MKCPECDSQQPDNAVTCSKCGLNFDAWREMNPIEASVMNEDMTFAEKPEDVAPPPAEETRAPEPAPKPVEKSNKLEPPQEGKKPLPVALIGGVVGGLILIGALVFFLKKPSTPVAVSKPVPTVASNPSPVLTAPSKTPSVLPSPATPVPAAIVAKPTNTPKPIPPTATYTATPKPKPTATSTPTDIPLDDKEDGAPVSGTESTPASKDASAPASEEHPADLLESAGNAVSPTPSPVKP